MTILLVIGTIAAVVYHHYANLRSQVFVGEPSVVSDNARLEVTRQAEPLPRSRKEHKVVFANIPPPTRTQTSSSAQKSRIEVHQPQNEKVLINGESERLGTPTSARASEQVGLPAAPAAPISKQLASASTEQLPTPHDVAPQPVQHESMAAPAGRMGAPQFPPREAAPIPVQYTGPATGVIIWSGRVEKGGTCSIDGNSVSSGTMQGALPGVPVMIDINTTQFAVAEAPSPSNAWKRLVIRSKKRTHSVVTIKWTVAH